MKRVVDGWITGEWLKPRTIVPVDFGEISKSSSNAEELMVISDVDVILISFICVTDVGVEGVVIPIVFVHIGILLINHKCHVEVVVGQTEMRGNIAWERAEGFLVHKLTPIEGVDVHIAILFS